MSKLSEWASELHPNGPAAAKTLFVAATVTALYKLTGHVLREYIIIPRTTILRDINLLHAPRRDGKIPGRAVICGGSIAGLLAAAVCADHFESVMVIEAETWASEHGTALPKIEGRIYRTTPSGYQTVTAPRTRVPQYYFGNSFQPLVFKAFSRLFPGLPRIIDKLNLGSSVIVAKLRITYGGLDLKDPDTDEDAASSAPITLCLTREATEIVLRNAVKESRPNVVFKAGTVSGVLAQEKGLTGVTVRENGVEKQEQANFVIDATGPSQVSYSKWLRSAGFSLPSDLRLEYDPIIRYAASVWTIPEHLHSKWPVPWGFKCGYIYTMSCDVGLGDPRALGFSMAENNQMVITLGGASVTDLPHSLPELRAYASDLYAANTIPEWFWQLFDFMEEHEEECKPFWADFRVSPMSWVQWHTIAKTGALPRNWVAVGDANMTLNPLYTQGIYKACVDATTLNAVLHSVPASSFTGKLPNLPGLFYHRQKPRIISLWDSNRANDYGWPTTIPIPGEDLSHNSWIRNYARSCMILAQNDPELSSVWWHVAMLLSPGTDLLAPWIALKVARYHVLGW